MGEVGDLGGIVVLPLGLGDTGSSIVVLLPGVGDAGGAGGRRAEGLG